jgi:hypothetical protein
MGSLRGFLIIVATALWVVTAQAAFTEFYMTSGGSNVNAGSTTANSAAYTSTNGNWSTSTHIFTPTDGSTPASSVNVGDFASLYVDGATTGVFIARVTAVGAGANGAITTSSTINFGTAPTTSATARSIKVGGAWLGPGGATTFPFLGSGAMSTLVNTSGDQVRLNAKNDQTYSMTSALNMSGLSRTVMEGYTSSAGDLGKATFTSNVTPGDNFTFSSNQAPTFIDIVFASTAASGTPNLFNCSIGGITCIRTIFHGGRGAGFAITGGHALLWECEAYDDNKSNTAGIGAFHNYGAGAMICVNCYSHDHASGSNADAFEMTTTAGSSIVLINTTAETSAGNGVTVGANATAGSVFMALNSNFYNMTGDAIKLNSSSSSGFPIIANNNFLKNTGKAINNAVTGQAGILYNNGRGSGTQANGSSDTLKSIVDTSTDITYASGVTPWNAPTTGDFTTVPASAAVAAGRTHFEENDGTNTGTLGYIDIGASQAATPTPTPTSTPTPTPTSTPCAGGISRARVANPQ